MVLKKQLFLVILLLLPLLFLLYSLFVTGVKDPIKYIYTITGATALTLLYITTSISMIRKAVNLIKYRRTIGLFSFFYALLHFLNFIVFDMELKFSSVLKATLEKPFIYLGLIAFLILLFMAVTSLRVFFTKYYRYHKVIYAVLILASIHFVMAQKALSINQWFYLLIMFIIGIFKFLQRTKMIKI
ncbi:ferric reductase-like transmembrane domain-containing protein [bacterium]|nr:ferric reductase-like transmembrane domain-containing protein [bacterium]MBU1883676.1 ferric reductase-like transmembrane domain-containing protein [bacterium]